MPKDLLQSPARPVKKKPIPYEFALEALEPAKPYTRSMFGCLAVYVDEKIVMVLRRRDSSPQDNGVWLATTLEHHPSLRNEFSSMRSIAVLGHGVTGWQVLPEEAPDFEESVMRACELILARDVRIGKTPKRKSRSGRGRTRNPGNRRRR